MYYHLVYNLYREEEYTWTYDKIKTSCGRKTATRLPLFTTGPTERTKQCMSPVEKFQLMFTAPIAEAILQQTILFAQQKNKEFSRVTGIYWTQCCNGAYSTPSITRLLEEG